SLEKTTFTEKQKEALLVTTVGKLIFNEIFPEDFPYINEPTKQNFKGTPEKYFIYEKGVDVREFIQELDDPGALKMKHLGAIIAECFRRFGTTQTAVILDKVKELGYNYSTKAGITISVSDVKVPDEKQDILEEAEQKANLVMKQYR